ncbi:MAG: hypothetical protein R2682_01520 [Pyrinomonadaceae bacterium]
MKIKIGRFFFAAVLVALVVGYEAFGQAAGDEAAIRQIAQTMQDGWNKRDGKMFASPFADYNAKTPLTG